MGTGRRWDRSKIRELRESLGLSPEEFAEHIRRSIKAQGLPPVKLTGMTIRRWESGATDPSVPMFDLLLVATGAKVERFWVDTD